MPIKTAACVSRSHVPRDPPTPVRSASWPSISIRSGDSAQENIQDTVVFFGSARIDSRKTAERALLRLTTRSRAAERTRGGAQAQPQGGGVVALLRGRAPAGAPADGVEPVARKSRATASSCAPEAGPGSWKPPIAARYEAGGKTIGLNIRLPFEQGPESLSHQGPALRVPLFLHAQVLVRLPREGAGGLSGRVRHARRDVRDPHAGADQEAVEEAAGRSSTAASTGTRSSTSNRSWNGARSRSAISDCSAVVDTPEAAFAALKEHLLKHHMVPATTQEKRAPGIAKTRG